MRRSLTTVGVLIVIGSFLTGTTATAQELEPIKLPAPQTDGGKPLMKCLKERQSFRAYDAKPLPPQVMSNLLWAAWGISRPDSGKRTAPSASNRQEIDIYVSTTDGVYLYDAAEHALQPVLAKDIRAETGTQPYVGTAPVNLIYVADFKKMRMPSEEYSTFYSAANTGFIAENVYLFCASEGLASCVRGLVPREELAKTLGLRPEQRVVLAHTIGYPKAGAEQH